MIALGTRVAYHHRAAVARFRSIRGDFAADLRGWELREGVCKNEYVNPAQGYAFDCDRLADLFRGWPQPLMPGRSQSRVNKTVMIWPEEGSGVVTGQVKRGRGESVKSYTAASGPWGEGEFEQGYFQADCYLDLYVIRHELKGTDYILVPTWAVRPT